jgi:hypothetical protein
MSPAKAMLWRPPHDEVQRSAVWGIADAISDFSDRQLLDDEDG